MTTSDLIHLLQEADPGGTLPVCVGNADVYLVQNLPAYYDGALQQLVHDESKRPFWTIIGARITRRGMKVDIVPMSVRDVLVDMPDLPVTFDDGDLYYPEAVERWRKEVRDVVE